MTTPTEKILRLLDDKSQAYFSQTEAAEGVFISFDTKGLSQEENTCEIKLENMKRWMALYRYNIYWMQPAFGTEEAKIPSETQYLLWEREDGLYCVLLPLIEADGDLRATLVGGKDGFAVNISGALPGATPVTSDFLYLAIGENPYELTHSAVKAVSEKLGTFKLREDKVQPEFMDYLGWCTWDAFYQSVDEEKVMQGLESFKQGGFPLGFMILDDGSWDNHNDYLKSIKANPVKFPKGYKELIQTAKNDYGIKIFGVWHCFEGYWAGVYPDSEAAQKYGCVPNNGVIRPWLEENAVEQLYLMNPEKIFDYYFDLYNYLRDQGVDMVKVDGQAALEAFTKDKFGRVSTMKRFQKAMQGAAMLYFDGSLIHCMSNANDVAYNMLATNVWRNTCDYVPDDKTRGQQYHVFMNGMHSMWTSTFSVPDWDMFQTHTPSAYFHAASRAISGGPLYVCDKPGMQDFDLLKKMAISDGTVLRCDRPALPTRDCLLRDCYRNPGLFKLMNHYDTYGVLGIFHCVSEAGEITDTFKPSDVELIHAKQYAAYFNKAKMLKVLSYDSVETLTLGSMDYELVSLSPIEEGFAAIGLMDKFNNVAGMISASMHMDGSYTTYLKDGGDDIGFYSEKTPSKILVNGNIVSFKYNNDTGLVTLSAPVGFPIEVKLFN